MSSQVVLITGGSRGLGRAMARSLADSGFDILFTYHTREDEARKVALEVEAKGRKAAYLQLDAGNLAQFDAFRGQVEKLLNAHWGANQLLFGLVNNAGTGGHQLIGELTEAEFDRLLNIHFKGVAFLTDKLLPLLENGGRIVNISSGLARFSMPGYAVYGSMKGAMEVYTRYLAKELGPRKITANVVAPGAIDNDFNKARFEAMPQMREMLASSTALGRVGVSEDIGGIVAFLIGKGGGWINGQRIEATGGVFL